MYSPWRLSDLVHQLCHLALAYLADLAAQLYQVSLLGQGVPVMGGGQIERWKCYMGKQRIIKHH